MNFRHEVKHIISYSDLLALRSRLSAVAKRDEHSIDGKYFIRSLYFDDPSDTALKEKLDGVNIREKFRLRYYNHDTSYIALEKKRKINGLCSKEITVIDQATAEAIINGGLTLDLTSHALLGELYGKMKNNRLAPKTIVDYTREAFYFPAGNVRVTLDYDIRTSPRTTAFFDQSCQTVSTYDRTFLLEVKWDSFLPDIIREAVSLIDCRSTSFSKYAACRIYG